MAGREPGHSFSCRAGGFPLNRCYPQRRSRRQFLRATEANADAVPVRRHAASDFAVAEDHVGRFRPLCSYSVIIPVYQNR